MAENKSSVSHASSYEAIGAFWDDHDFTEFDDLQRPDVHFDIHDSIRIEAGLLETLEKFATDRGVSVETLVNLWLQEKAQSLVL